MIWKNSWILLILVLVGCGGSVDPLADVPSDYLSREYLIEVSELDSLLELPEEVLILDIRKPKQYQKGHLPGAINIWRPAITDTTYPYGGMAINPARMEQLLDSVGVKPSAKLVFYDGKGGSDAVRMWWLLYRYGHQKMAVLNGGIQAWKKHGGTVDTAEVAFSVPSQYQFVADRYGELNADLALVKQAIVDTANYFLLDTRSADEYSGKRQKKGAFRAGRIPGSVLYDWGNSVHLDGDHLLKSMKDLTYMLDSIGVPKNKTIITYCHTGVRSAHTAFVLSELMNYPKVLNYDGSWSEWSYYESLPIEKDVEEPSIKQ